MRRASPGRRPRGRHPSTRRRAYTPRQRALRRRPELDPSCWCGHPVDEHGGADGHCLDTGCECGRFAAPEPA